jgi:hypothetical protein
MKNFSILVFSFAVIMSLSAAPAGAAQLFPPENDDPPAANVANANAALNSGKVYCANGAVDVLSWSKNGDDRGITCIDPSSRVNVTPCAAGSYLTGISKGVAVCAPLTIADCPQGQHLVGIDKGEPHCTNGTVRYGTEIKTISNECPDPVVPKPDPWQSGLSGVGYVELLYRWVNTCGARYCNHRGYATGKVSEYYAPGAMVDCW